MVEHHLAKVRVASSSLVFRSVINGTALRCRPIFVCRLLLLAGQLIRFGICWLSSILKMNETNHSLAKLNLSDSTGGIIIIDNL